jgi:hypothetical protein
LTSWKQTRDDAATFLAEAEESRARQVLAVKEAELADFQVEYNSLKEEYDGLYAQEMSGAIGPGDADYERMLELEDTYHENQVVFDSMEAERVA